MTRRPLPLTRRAQLLALGAGLGLAATGGRAAPGPFEEGKHYQRINPPVPTGAGAIEVVEFFWYGCPLCNAFEPALQAWVKSLPPGVAFRHQHAFLREATRPHQRLWFALSAMGVEAQFRSAIFAALHVERRELDTPEAMIKLLQPLGLDVARFQSTWASFDPKGFGGGRIEAANRQANQAYQIHGVPTLAIGGQFLVSVADAAERRGERPTGASALRLTELLLASLQPKA